MAQVRTSQTAPRCVRPWALGLGPVSHARQAATRDTPTDRDLASMQEARSLAQRAKQAAPALAEFTQEQIDKHHRRRCRRGHAARGRVRAAGGRRNRLRRRRRQDREEPLRVRAGLPVHPADEDGRRRRARRDAEDHRNRRAVRRRRGDRAVDQPDVDGDLQDPDLPQGALPDRHEPASVSGAVHHPRRRGDGRSGRCRRSAGGRDQLDADGHARGHAGIDEASRRRGHPRDRRHGTGARRLQRRQAGLRRRAGQRAVLHREVR